MSAPPPQSSSPPLLHSMTHGSPSALPILILHGWSLSSLTEIHTFEPIFNSLPTDQRRYHRIYPSLPTHGNTPSLSVQNLDDMLHHLIQFINTTIPSPTQHFLLIGTSAGAYFARALLHHFSSRIDGVLLRVPMVQPFNRDLPPFTPLVTDAAVLSGLSPTEKDLFGNQVLVQTEGYVQALRETYAAAVTPALAQGENKALLDAIRGDPSRYRLSVLDDSSETESGNGGGGEKHIELTAPTLIVTGRQDGVVGYRDSLKLLDSYPRATFAVLDRADHALPVDDKEGVFAALVRDWLGRVEEWREHISS